jgi:hypothetical protein
MKIRLTRGRTAALAALAATAALLIHLATTGGPGTEPAARQDLRIDATAMLPLTSSQINAAAEVARRFITAFGTYRYDQAPDTYLNRLAPLTDEQLLAALSTAVHDPAWITQRQRDHDTSTAGAAITGIHDLTPSSVTILVAGHAHTASVNGRRDTDQTFQVTVTLHTGTWLVSSVQNTTSSPTPSPGQSTP